MEKKLNPLLFEDDILKPAIKEKILQIVDEFLEYANVEDIKILDVRLVGSNAAYNYTEYSDLDVHIVTDLSKISDPETIARLYFDSIKKNFKDSYDITIKGIEVEMYVEDINSSAQSNGIYSVTQDKWIKEPTPAEVPTEEEISSANQIEREIAQSIKDASSLEELQEILDKLYLMRKDALSTSGETAPGNLAFKSLRNKGILDKIKDTLRIAISQELSLESKELTEDVESTEDTESIEEEEPEERLPKRSKYGVGKQIGNQIYFHKKYVSRICPKLYETAREMLEEEYPDFSYNCLMFDKSRPGILRFDEAPDFDTAREPKVGTMYSVDTGSGKIIKRYSPQVWHHKWLWVQDDYQGFDVEESREWSRTYLKVIETPSGYEDKWIAQLKQKGLE